MIEFTVAPSMAIKFWLTVLVLASTHPAEPALAALKATCVLNHFREAQITGTIHFTQERLTEKTKVEGTISGLGPGKHGFHVHEFGDSTNGCTSFGGHFNPFDTSHGAPDAMERHAGDLGNIEADATGTAEVSIQDAQIPLTGANSIIGRGLVVHEKPDDLGLGGDAESLKTGNAGSRIACCVIGLSQPEN